MADFQRRHYQAVADILDAEVRGLGDDTASMRRGLAERFARMFAADNPRFDRARFFKACGVED